MSELPLSWVTAPLSDLCNRIVDGSHNPPSATERGKPMLSARNIQQRRILFDNYRLIPDSAFEQEHLRTQATSYDILLTIVGTIGRVAIVQEDTPEFTLQRSVAVLKPNTSLTPRFLAYALESPRIQKHLTDNAKGTAQKGIYLKALGNLEMEVAPLSEQKRIADKLDAVLARVDDCRGRLDRIPAILKRFRQSVLAAATSGKLTEDWLAEHVARMQPQAESGNTARDSAQSHYVVTIAPDSATLHPGYEANVAGWQQTDVQSVAHVGTGSTPLRSNSTFFASRGTPWITSAATSQALVTDANEFVTQAAITAHRLKTYPIGTLLVAMYGEGKTRGQVTELGIPATINQACAAIIVNEEKALKHYVKLVLQANYFEMRELAEGGNQPNLNLSKIKEFPLSLPGITEQTEIVRRVEALFACADRLEARYTAARAQVEKLTPATLAKAFRGELVPQDPNDEPASVLLERIKTQRNEPRAGKHSRSRREPG